MTWIRETVPGEGTMAYDQHTWHVEIEEEDERPVIIIFRKYELAAQRDCTLCGRHFREGDVVEVIVPREMDLYFVDTQDGPWGYRGHTSRWLQENAQEIKDSRTGEILYCRKKEK
jgi:hypothetical protein